MRVSVSHLGKFDLSYKVRSVHIIYCSVYKLSLIFSVFLTHPYLTSFFQFIPHPSLVDIQTISAMLLLLCLQNAPRKEECLDMRRQG